MGGGPCLSAVFEQQTVRVDDLRSEQRWPRFAATAVAAGAAAMVSFQLYVEDDNLGALNLISRRPGAFTDKSEHLGLMLAAHRAVALAGAQKQNQLRRSVESRDLIGQAKGISMERHQLNADQAFAVLLRTSQDHNLKLRDVAAQLTTTGQLPPSSPRSSR